MTTSNTPIIDFAERNGFTARDMVYFFDLWSTQSLRDNVMSEILLTQDVPESLDAFVLDYCEHSYIAFRVALDAIENCLLSKESTKFIQFVASKLHNVR